MEQIRGFNDELVDKLRSKGFSVFDATRARRPENDFTFESIDDFMACAGELGIRVIFIETQQLDEAEFFHDEVLAAEYDDDAASDENVDDGIDLRNIDGRLRAFEQYIGECQMVLLIGCFGSASISYYQSTEWLGRFEEMREQAAQMVRESSEEAAERLMLERQKKTQEVLTAISRLSDNDAFNETFSLARPTQGAIVAYIRTNIDGSEELQTRVLRDAANQLRDRLLLRR